MKVIMIGTILLILTGCGPLGGSFAGRVDPVRSEREPTKGAETGASLNYDFEDILIPIELKVNPEQSFILGEATRLGIPAGALTATGWVDAGSVIEFFKDNMPKDNWRLLSIFRLRRTVMCFIKPTRSCIINIRDGRFGAIVEIWVNLIRTNNLESLKKAHEGVCFFSFVTKLGDTAVVPYKRFQLIQPDECWPSGCSSCH